MKKGFVSKAGEKVSVEALPEEKGYRIDIPKVLSKDELIQLRLAIQQILDKEYEEMLEERRAKGQKTYVEYRGEEVVTEY